MPGPEASILPLFFFDHSSRGMVKENRIRSQRKQVSVCTLSIPDRLFIFQFICACFFFLPEVLSSLLSSQPSSSIHKAFVSISTQSIYPRKQSPIPRQAQIFLLYVLIRCCLFPFITYYGLKYYICVKH